MNNYEKNNNVIIKGHIEEAPVYSHSVLGEGFYEFKLTVPRLSEQVDKLPVTISERLLPQIKGLNQEIGIVGQLRSYNKLENDKSRLILTVFAREVVPADEISNSNQIVALGYVCKEPIYRTTPFGREITDVLIAVNRAYNKSDYLPCIAWGRNARYTGDLAVGEKVKLIGRIQSREYQKHTENGEVLTKTAYEVSISSIMPCQNENLDESNNEIMDYHEELMGEILQSKCDDNLFSNDDVHVSER